MQLLGEQRQPWRAVNIWFLRRTLMRNPPVGLRGIDGSGRLIWAPGYPRDEPAGSSG